MTSKKTFVLAVRLPNGIKAELNLRAERRGMSLGEYLKDCIVRSVNTSVNTENEFKDAKNGVSVNTVNTTKSSKEELQAMIKKMEGKPATDQVKQETKRENYPWYDSSKHSEGDTVLQRDPVTKEAKVVTL